MIYLVIALATGASAAASIIGGILIAIVAILIGFVFRGVATRWGASRRG